MKLGKQNEILSVKSNYTSFDIDEMIEIVKRDNNKKRTFLLLNKLQSKHYPSDPLKTDKLFSSLAKGLKEKYSDKNRVLIIGFAETAVSIGAYVALEFENSHYIKTTRQIFNEPYITFDETHSHAVEHRIYTQNLSGIIENTDLIIIADDEFTTGNTAVNLVALLRDKYNINHSCKICIASVLNCMKQENIRNIQKKGIEIFSVINARLNENNIVFPDEVVDDITFPDNKKIISYNIVQGKVSPHTAVSSKEYLNKCNKFIMSIMNIIENINSSDNTLVLGTEEFSFCALKLGINLKNKNYYNVSVQCTTQSPVLAFKNDYYAINCRSKILSLYDSRRVTYIYQMKHYNTVIILTDSENIPEQSIKKLINAIDADRIFFIQWRE